MNELLVPVWAPPVVRVAVIVKLPVLEIVTAWELSTPAVNAAVVPPPDEGVPVEVLSTVPVNPVTVLPFESRAVTRMLKLEPAVCGPRQRLPGRGLARWQALPGWLRAEPGLFRLSGAWLDDPGAPGPG